MKLQQWHISYRNDRYSLQQEILQYDTFTLSTRLLWTIINLAFCEFAFLYFPHKVKKYLKKIFLFYKKYATSNHLIVTNMDITLKNI